MSENTAAANNATLPLHMYIRPLILEDLPAVRDLEAKCFPPNERASEERIKYRLQACPELCSGLFVRQFNASAKTVEAETLIGHILGTKIATAYITLESMASGAHDEASDVVAVHALVIDPQFQKKNLATLLMTDYIQKLSNQEIGSKIVIINHEQLVPFYERLGFEVVGDNKDVLRDPDFAKSKWINMERELVKEDYDN